MKRPVLMISLALLSACAASTEDPREEEELGEISQALTQDGSAWVIGSRDHYTAEWVQIPYGSNPNNYGDGHYAEGWPSGNPALEINNFPDRGSNGRDIVATLSGTITCDSSKGRIRRSIPKFTTQVVHPKNIGVADVTIGLARYCASGERPYSFNVTISQTSYGR